MRKLMLVGCLVLAACAPAPPPTEAPAAAPASVAVEAPAAPADDAPVPAAVAPVPSFATLRGRVSYPSEELPAMRVCALATEDMGLGYCAETAVNTPHYELRVPGGTWIVLAWPRGTGTAGDPGLLSNASECLGTGGTGCDDHGFLEITVNAGEEREGLDINDWYYDPQTQSAPMEPRGETPPQ